MSGDGDVRRPSAPEWIEKRDGRRVAFDTAPLPAGLARVQSDAAPALRASQVDLASVDELLKTITERLVAVHRRVGGVRKVVY